MANSISAGQPRASVTERLARWVVAADDDPLPADVLAKTRRMMLDALGAAIGGSENATAERSRRVLTAAMPGDAASLIGLPYRAALPIAAFVNAVAMHALEVDDGYTRGSVHPSTVVLPAVLAVAETVDSSMDDIIRAFAVGAEIVCRIAEAGHPETYARGFHNTALSGALGAAAATAVLLGLNDVETTHAIGMACSHSGGLFEFLSDGADVKKIHPGIAARDGVLCALMAQEGITGPRTALEGPRGYFRAFTGDVGAAERVIDNLGTNWRLLEVYHKMHACCRALHSSIDALLEIKAAHNVEWGSVRSVTIRTYGKAAEYNNRVISSLIDAQMSLPLTAVVALQQGTVGYADIESALTTVTAADLDRVTIQHGIDLDPLYPPLRPATAIVKTDFGSYENYIDIPYGEPKNPVTDVRLVAKFEGLVGPVLGLPNAGRIVNEVLSGRPSGRELASLLSASATAMR